MVQKAYCYFFGYLNLSGGKLFSFSVSKCFLFFLVNFPKLPEISSCQSTTDRCRDFDFARPSWWTWNDVKIWRMPWWKSSRRLVGWKGGKFGGTSQLGSMVSNSCLEPINRPWLLSTYDHHWLLSTYWVAWSSNSWRHFKQRKLKRNTPLSPTYHELLWT